MFTLKVPVRMSHDITVKAPGYYLFRPFGGLRFDIEAWCVETFGYWPECRSGDDNDWLHVYFHFQRDADAIAFKLKWL